MSGTAVVALVEGTFADPAPFEEAGRGWAQVRHVRLPDTGEVDVAALEGAAAIAVGLQPVTAAVVAALPASVRVIGRAGIGLDSIDLDAARRAGIAVTHQPDYATEEVATHAVAMVLALSRRLLLADATARTSWPSWERFTGAPALGESCVGVVGLGRIGRAVAARLAPMAGRVVGFDPGTDDAVPGVERMGSLEALLAASDVVTLHLPLVASTVGLINRETLSTMRPGALLVNVARGGLVDEEALAAALVSGRLAGAALDVLSVEPPPPDHPLLTSPNTLLSPHTAWISASSQERLQRWTMGSMREVLQGSPITHGRSAVVGSR